MNRSREQTLRGAGVERPIIQAYFLPWMLAAYIAIFVTVYLVVLVSSYGFLDDYTILAQSMRHELLHRSQTLVGYGRPLCALLERLALPLVHDVSGLRLFRAIAVLGTALLAVLCYAQLRRARLPRAVCLGLPVMLGLMPAFQVYVAWAIAGFFPIAAALGGSSFVLLDASAATLPSIAWWRPVAAVALLTAALCLYQPAAMFFWVFAAISWLGGAAPVKWPEVGRALSTMAIALVTDFVFAKLLPHLFWDPVVLPDRTGLVRAVFAKLVWFLSEPLPSALNLPFIWPSTWVAGGVALFSAVGLWLYRGPTTLRHGRVPSVLIGIALVPATYLPNLIVVENWASYRTQVALTSLLLVYAILALLGWLRTINKASWLPVAMAIFVVVCAVTASRNVTLYFVLPQRVEYRQFTSALLKLRPSNTKQLDFYTTSRWSLSGLSRYDEFGYLSSNAIWVPPAMAWLILQANGSPLANVPMQVFPRGQRPQVSGSQLLDLDPVMFEPRA